MTITEQIADTKGAPGIHIPGFTGQGWSTHETMLVVRWLFAHQDVWDQAMAVAREQSGNPHTVADTLHEHLVPRPELTRIAAAGFDPAKVNWLEIAHELIERRSDPQPGHEHAGDTAGITLAAGDVTVAPQAMQPPGLPVPADKTDISMFTAHRLGDMLSQMSHAAQRMQAARGTSSPDLRAYRSAHIHHHLGNALNAAHWLADNIRDHYPAEAAELEQVKQAIGLAKAVSPEAKAATTAHLLETTLHEMTHGVRHADAMLKPSPDAEWEFNADHAEKHLNGALEHASKLARHVRDNYPDEAKCLAGLDEITAGAEEGDGKQHARYERKTSLATISAQALEMAATISAQVDLADVDVRPFQRVVQTRNGPRTEEVRGHVEQRNWISQPKWQAGQQEWEARGVAARAAARGRLAARAGVLPWEQQGDVVNFRDSMGVDRAQMPQLSGTLPDGRYAPSSEMLPQFTKGLRARGIRVTDERVPASSLHPVQTTGDTRVVRGIADALESGDLEDTKPVIVSSDNRVLDGHHTWAGRQLADAEGGHPGLDPDMPVTRIDVPMRELLDMARDFNTQVGIQPRKTGEVANPAFKHLVSAPTAARTISGQATRGEPVSGGREGIRSLPLDAQHFITTMNMQPLPQHEVRPTDTLNMHMRPGGTWTPERAALHQRIIDDILAGHKPQEHPVATFFGGGPASGKSTALKATAPDSAHIDPDEIKARLPEYQQMLGAKDPRAASFVHEESSHIAKQAVKQAHEKHVNYVLDGTGDSHIDKLAGKVNAAKKAGYTTEGQYVTVGTDEAVRRANERGKATGRYVPETTIRETHAAVSDTYAKASKMGLFDKTELWDTSGPKPALVANKVHGGKFRVKDPQAWQRFLAKAHENAAGKAKR